MESVARVGGDSGPMNDWEITVRKSEGAVFYKGLNSMRHNDGVLKSVRLIIRFGACGAAGHSNRAVTTLRCGPAPGEAPGRHGKIMR